MYFVAKPNEEAKSFIQAAGLTNETQMKAIGTLVFDLKNYNLWDKMKAIYPFVGGTSGSHKFNLKDPRDTDAAFRLTFSGSWTHTSTGAKPDGNTAWADTFLIPSNNLSQNSTSLGFYSGTSLISFKAAMGSVQTTPSPISAIQIYPAYTSQGFYGDVNDGSTVTTPNTDSTGFIFAYRTTSNQKKHSIRNSITTLNEISSGLSTYKLHIGARNVNGTAQDFSTYEHRFSFIGDGLTDTEAANLYTAVQRFQTTLGRQV